MTRMRLFLAIVVACVVAAGSYAPAANLFWEGRTVESGGSLDSNWDVGGAVNWNLNTEAGTLVSFSNGDSVTFKDDGGGNNDNTTVVIAAGGVSPNSITFNRGFGVTYNISGGDILTGAMFGIRDDTKNFTRNGSYSFSGGTSITAGGSIFNYAPTTAGTYNFGTGTITLSNGSFNFNPVNPSTLTNNFVLNGGSITGNGNATFSGNLTVGGNNVNAPQNSLFVFPSLTLTQNTTINVDRCCSTAPAVQFNSNINGAGIHSITLASGSGNADWTSRVGAPSGSWDVLNITKSNRGRLQFDANDPDDFFAGMKANGGTFFHRGGTIQFRTASQTNIPVFDLDFRMIFDPAAAVTGPGVTQTGAGFNGLTTLNIIAGGVLGGVGTVAGDNNLDGNNGTFESNVNVNVNSGGAIAPGMSAGILNIKGALTMNAGSQLQIEIDGSGVLAGTDYDRLAVAGAVTLNGADLFIDIDPDLRFMDLTGNSYRILTAVNDLSGQSLGDVTFSSVPGGYWSADFVLGNGFLDIINLAFTVPEPSSWSLLGLGAVALGWRVRRRRAA